MVRARVEHTVYIGLLLASTAGAQQAPKVEAPACYELTFGPWTPALGGARQLSTPPDTLELFDDANYLYPRPGWKRAGPPIVHAYSRGRERAYWMSLDSTSFRVIWSDGFTGADLRMYQGSDAYFGLIRALSDAIGPEATIPKATVVGRRIACKPDAK